jgi:hypothetical protein
VNPVPFSWMLIGLFVAFVGGGSTAWHVASWKYEGEKERSIVAAQEAQVRAEKRADVISDKFMAKLDSLKVTQTTINRTINHELETRVYSDCKLPDSGLVLFNSSVDAANNALGFPSPVRANPSPAAEPARATSNDGRSVPSRQRFDSALRELRAEAAGSSAKHDGAKAGKRSAAGAVTAPLRE